MGLWHDLFGPGQNEAWAALAKQVGGDFTPAGWTQKGRIDLHKGDVVITLDTYTVSTGKSSATYTRMRSPFRNPHELAMYVHRKSIFTGLGKLFGMQDITIGDALFDDGFVVQGRPELSVIAFLSDAQIRRLIAAQPSIAFRIKPDDGWFAKQYPDGIDELYFVCGGMVKDAQRLKDLFELFVAAIDALSDPAFGCDFGVHLTPK